jgi:putative nucleotidyltransferase with HDIG domain
MINVLFVDDEPLVLEGLRDSFRSCRNEWMMTFAEGGEAAMRELAAGKFDVIVSDMRMPGVGGAELLRHVREHQPATIRIVLSGHSKFEDTLDAAPFAHQFLAKPCSPDKLRSVIERSCKLHDVLADAALRQAVSSITSLPSAPRAYLRFAEALADPDITATELGALVERDLAVFPKLLQLVNSSFFGLNRRITTGRDAVAYLGLAMLRILVLSTELFQTFASAEAAPALTAVERHSIHVARLASRLAPSRLREDAVAGGLLHDAGKLVLIGHSPRDFMLRSRESVDRGVPLHEVERVLLGFTHAEVGAYLLGLWGLPYVLVDAVARHHLPETLGATDGAGVVATANALVNERDGQPIDPELLEALERVASGSLETWRRAAHHVDGVA